MSFSIFDDKQIDLDLNGPILSFTTNPTGVGSTGVGINSTGGGTVSLTGIATATFPTSANNAGYVTYRWHEENVGALSDSTYVTGTATTTLTLSNLITPTDDGRKFFVQADYVPSYYVTGNATNEPLNSGVGTVTVDPLIEIIAQPTSATVTDQSATFTLDASLTNNGTDLAYQWQLDGSDVTNGTVTKSTVGEIEGTEDNRIIQTTQTSAQFTIPANVTNVRFNAASAAGGNGGGLGGYQAGGTGGAGVSLYCTIPTSTSARIVTFTVGRKGQDGGTGSHNHAHAAPGAVQGGQSGNGTGGRGCGGGAGGSATSIVLDGVLVAVLGGGGGGGGGGLSGVGENGSGYGDNEGVDGVTRALDLDRGDSGQSGNAGGGGGGGGDEAGTGGSAGVDGFGGDGGGRGASVYRSDYITRLDTADNPISSGWGSLEYTQGQNIVTTVGNVSRTTTISGSTSKTLTLSTDGPGIGYTVCASVSSATATNSPIKSNIVNYQVLDSQEESIIMIEAIGVDSTATVSEVDLNADEDGDVELGPAGVNVNNNIFTQFYSIYAKDRDLDVEMDLYGGGTNSVGGEGGFSRIRFTMSQNEEYVIAGLINSVNTPFVYRRGALMVCVGEGGKGGVVGKSGGDGGGVGVAGGDGFGMEGSGSGANLIPNGQLTLSGIFGSASPSSTLYPGDTQAGNNRGGRTIRCTKGVYWAQQGIPPCNDISGNTKFRLSDGTEVTNTASITRGFKAGYNIMQTAGKGTNAFRGGNGATGGEGGDRDDAGGGGGSGYSDGTVTVVSTRLGGSTEEAKVILRMQS